MTIEESRTQFEERVFLERFIKSIKRNPDKPKNAIAGCLDFVPINCPNKDEFLAKDDKGEYKDESVSAMWFGYQLALKDDDKPKFRPREQEYNFNKPPFDEEDSDLGYA